MKNVFSKPHSPQGELYQRKWFIAALAGVVMLALFFLPNAFGGASDAVSSKLLRERFPETFRIAIIADLDKRSKMEGGKLYRAPYVTGTLKRTGEKYSVEWDAAVDLVTSHNEAGRGAELSELVRYQGALYTFDDRTGIMFEVINPEDSGSRKPKPEAYIAPRHIFMEGDGSTDKGMKVEWATVKDGLLYVGSFGKEFTNNEGGIIHSNNLWITVVDKDGKMMHADWREQYTAMRKVLGYEHPAYLLHETVMWSPYHKQWFVLPRRVSKDAYDEAEDERKGSNTIITASADFKSIKAHTVGEVSPLRGFSSAKFLPGSRDSVIVALKSEENSERDRQTAYFTIFGQTEDGSGWKVLLDELEIPGEYKFEGIEVLSWQ